jgi:hypothetical protein
MSMSDVEIITLEDIPIDRRVAAGYERVYRAAQQLGRLGTQAVRVRLDGIDKKMAVKKIHMKFQRMGRAIRTKDGRDGWLYIWLPDPPAPLKFEVCKKPPRKEDVPEDGIRTRRS